MFFPVWMVYKAVSLPSYDEMKQVRADVTCFEFAVPVFDRKACTGTRSAGYLQFMMLVYSTLAINQVRRALDIGFILDILLFDKTTRLLLFAHLGVITC